LPRVNSQNRKPSTSSVALLITILKKDGESLNEKRYRELIFLTARLK